MSLLIKALKQAERKHAQAKQPADADKAHETADVVEATAKPAAGAIASSTPGAPDPAREAAPNAHSDTTLAAIDGADVELQIEVAKLQGEQASGPSEQGSTLSLADPDMPVWSLALSMNDVPEAPKPAATGEAIEPAARVTDAAGPVGSALLLDSPSRTDERAASLASAAPAPNEMNGTGVQDSAPAFVSPMPAAEPPAVQSAAPAESPAEGPDAVREPAKASRKKRKQPEGKAASPVLANRRFQVYGAVALLALACIGWVLADMFGVNPLTSPRRPAPAPVMATAPGMPPATDASVPPMEPAKDSKAGGASSSDVGAMNESAPAGRAPKTGAAERKSGTSAAEPKSSLRGGVRAAQSQASSPGASKPSDAALAASPGDNSSARGPKNAGAARAAQPAAVPAEPAPLGTPQGVKLSKSESFAEQTVRLNEQAWQSLARNDFTAARAAYEQVLKLDRNNADAWIGLGSIAARSGDVTSADLHYRKALEIDPNDSAARAGLYALHSNHEPQGQGGRLRHLLERDVAQPALVFALGNSLAAQGRWPEAQQAYFNAFAADPGNGDYAFNLAVSLERIRQPKAAANYYRRAVELAERRPVQFDRAAAQRRLQAIEQPAPAPADEPAADTRP